MTARSFYWFLPCIHHAIKTSCMLTWVFHRIQSVARLDKFIIVSASNGHPIAFARHIFLSLQHSSIMFFSKHSFSSVTWLSDGTNQYITPDNLGEIMCFQSPMAITIVFIPLLFNEQDKLVFRWQDHNMLCSGASCSQQGASLSCFDLFSYVLFALVYFQWAEMV